MEKVICDVCGIAYPETASQCPICGCARTDNAQTSACDTVQVDEENAYAATKGGRFSKNNVRKRLKAQQIQPVPLEIPPRASKKEEAVYDEDEDYEEYDQDDDDDMPASNKGLVIVVVLLLLAIIAVSSYIAIVHFDIFGSNKPSQGVKDPVLSTTAPTNAPDPTDPSGPADPTDPTDPVVKIPCTNVQADATLTLGKDLPTMQLSYSVEPVDTTDDVKFTSNNPAVATVDSKGRVTAVSTGEATIFITCGSITKECVVTCYMDDEPDVPDEPMPDLKLRMTDASFNAKGYQWRAFERTEGFDETKFTWTMDDETIATVDNGFVTTVAPGRTTLRVYYKGEQVASCIIRCNWTEEPEVPEDPENPDDPVDPPAEVKYEIKINNVNPAYKYNNQDNTAEVSQAVGHKFKLTLVDKELAQIMNDVVWTLSDETVCKLDGNNVVGLKKGTCKITCEYDGVTYLVFVRVTN